jgi:hypothetical protein
LGPKPTGTVGKSEDYCKKGLFELSMLIDAVAEPIVVPIEVSQPLQIVMEQRYCSGRILPCVQLVASGREPDERN